MINMEDEMTQSMVRFQEDRLRELANGAPIATPSTTGAIWNFTKPLSPLPMALPTRKK